MLIQRRGPTKFSNFFQCQKKICLPKGVAMAQWPPKHASGIVCFTKKQTKLQCSSIYTSEDRRIHVSDLEKCPWPWCRRSRIKYARFVAVPLNCSTQKKLRNETNYNALARILPKIRRVTYVTLKNVRDLDVEGHASIVQGLWQCHWLVRPKKTEKKNSNSLAHI